MSAPNTGIVMFNWTVGSTNRLTYLMLGFVPDYVRLILDHTGTNPNAIEWFNKGGQTLPASQQAPSVTTAPNQLSQWGGATNGLLTTGSSGIVTQVTGVSAYFGGDQLAATVTKDSNPTYVHPDGTFGTIGLITPAGISIAAALLTSDKLVCGYAIRRSESQKVTGF
jgi:hypothetical protein